jgi:hypothetical protein
MTTTINASTSSGLVQTADTSGIIKLQSNGVTTNALAWVNFSDVSGTVSVRASYNVSSITRNSAGNFTFTFNSATTDANYSVCGSASNNGSGLGTVFFTITGSSFSNSSFVFGAYSSGGSLIDSNNMCVAVFGN